MKRKTEKKQRPIVSLHSSLIFAVSSSISPVPFLWIKQLFLQKRRGREVKKAIQKEGLLLLFIQRLLFCHFSFPEKEKDGKQRDNLNSF